MRRRRERGIVLISVVVFAMAIMALTASVVMSGVAVRGQVRTYAAAQEAAVAAESGVHLVAARLSGPERDALLAAGRDEGVLRGSGAAAPRYAVTLRRGHDDFADNDLDGLVDEEDEADIVEVASTGSYDRVSRTVYVTLLARYREPDLQSAIYVENPAADPDLDGAAFTVSGYDLSLARVPTGLAVAGIGVNGDPALMRSKIRGWSARRIMGLGGTPSVLEVPPLDLQALIEEGARSADVVLAEGEVNQPPEEGAWGTIHKPAVAYSSGSVKISGGSAGAGVLLVNGDLEISGSFEWTGLIIVRGKVAFKGGGGKRLLGGLVVQDWVGADDGSVDGVRLTGTVDILYSRDAIRKVARILSSYTLLNWREGPSQP